MKRERFFKSNEDDSDDEECWGENGEGKRILTSEKNCERREKKKEKK